MTKTTKLVALLLLLAMAATAIAGCGSEKKPETTTAAPTDTALSTEPTVTTIPEIKPDIPDDLTFDGTEFLIYNGNNVGDMDDFTVVEGEGGSDVVNAARFQWLSGTEERFDIKIVEEVVVSSFSFIGTGTGYSLLQKAYSAADMQYDAVEINVYDMAGASSHGWLADMSDYEYIDLNQDWWDDRVNTDLSFAGKVYFTTGEISLSDNHSTHCIIFNKEMAKQMQLDPYDRVRQNTWTIDNFITEIKLVSEDVNGDDKRDGSDKYGLLTWDDSAYGILASIGEATVLPDENGELALTFFSEKTTDAFEKYRDIYFSEYVYNFYRVGIDTGYAIQLFSNNQMLYYMTKFNILAKMRDTEVDYGIIPFPKYDSEQENYGHVVAAFDVGFIGIPAIVENEELTGSVLEYLAYTGQKIMTPAYYEKTLKGTLVRDDESADMLDIIFSSHIYDVGLYLNVGGIRDLLKTLANTKTMQSLPALKAIYENRYTSALNRLNDSFKTLAENDG